MAKQSFRDLLARKLGTLHGYSSFGADTLLRPSVSDGFIRITAVHEGIVPWLYLDRLGLVTTAIGNLVEASGKPTANLFQQSWKNSSGDLASSSEIQNVFDVV